MSTTSRTPFASHGPFVVRGEMTYGTRAYKDGEAFEHAGVDMLVLAMLHAGGKIDVVPALELETPSAKGPSKRGAARAGRP